MNLLYCQNGAVIAIHDDAEVAVHPSRYGAAAMRVIPWPDPLSTLQKVGPPPGTDPRGHALPDTRMYAEPQETPTILKRYAAQQRYQATAGGLDFNAASGVVPVKGDRMSWLLIGHLATYAKTLAPTATIDFSQDNIHYPLTAAECQTMFEQFSAMLEENRTVEAACIADLNLANPTLRTYEDVEARFAPIKARYRKDVDRWW